MGERNIYERGCMRAAEEWVEDNFIGVLTTVMTVTILQVDQWLVQLGLSWHVSFYFNI
jgi:hypothetical protein